VNTAKETAGQLASQGRVAQSGLPCLEVGGHRRGRAGTECRRKLRGTSGPGGTGGPAAQAGFQAVDGHEVYWVDYLLRRLPQHRPGDRVTVQAFTVAATLRGGPRP